MNNDLDYLKNKFNEANLQIPDALDEKVMQNYNSPAKKVPFTKKRAFKTAVSLVACFAIFAACFSAVRLNDNREAVKYEHADGLAIQTFNDYDDLEAYIKKMDSFGDRIVAFTSDTVKSAFNDNENLAAASDFLSQESAASITSSAETYTQVNDVDEADTIKTYGKYIFRLNRYYEMHDAYDSDCSGITIFEADKGKTKVVSRIRFENKTYFDEEDSNVDENGDADENEIIICDSIAYNTVSEFYVTGERLIVNISNFDENNEYMMTKSIVYDISDIKHPKEIYSFKQRGAYVSSRMINDTLYLVSDYYVDHSFERKKCIPTVCENDGKSIAVEPQDIAYSDCRNKCFTVVSAIDTKNGKRIGKTKSVIGAGSEVYCTTENLYIIGWDYNRKGIESTSITKLSFDNGIQFGASAKVRGTYDSQYSFNEKGDTFFACVTGRSEKDDKELNYIYSFDKNMKQIGKTKAFGKDESVRAVKYIGDYAYVITYEQTDPLFVIDISDPENMQIKGSVKISGFSTMLVPVGDDKLLGIGNSTSELEDADMEAIDGVKLALFDISNPEKPKVLDSKVYRDRDSAAQYNPKALIINHDKDYMAIPMEDYNGEKSGAVLFNVKENKIVEKDSFYHDYADEHDYSETRITFVDDYIYVLDESEHVNSHFVK